MHIEFIWKQNYYRCVERFEVCEQFSYIFSLFVKRLRKWGMLIFVCENEKHAFPDENIQITVCLATLILILVTGTGKFVFQYILDLYKYYWRWICFYFIMNISNFFLKDYPVVYVKRIEWGVLYFRLKICKSLILEFTSSSEVWRNMNY